LYILVSGGVKAASANGRYFELEFARKENKEITRCTLKAQGMEVVGIKRAK
jgi:hypothetical protein